MLRRFLSVALLSVLAASVASGAEPSKVRDWASSPQAYFMTAAERSEWAAVRTDEEAQKFIDAFLARRPEAFAAEVAKRAEMADKYLTVPGTKTPGSKTLRGKAIILLGPPAGVEVSEARAASRSHPDNQSYVNATMSPGGGDRSSAAAGGGGGGLNVDGGMVTSLGGDAEDARIHRYYTLTFRGDAARLIDKDEVTVALDADTSTGKDRVAIRSLTGEVDRLFEAAAKASLTKP